MARKFYQQTTGNDQLRKLENFLDVGHLFGVVVGTKETTPKKRMLKGSPVRSRDAVLNLIIYRTQAKKGRDPVFLDDKEIATGNQFWARAMDEAHKGDLNSFRKIARELANFFVSCVRKHIDEQRGVGGSLPEPTSERYIEAKKARWGEDATKTLYASGQLYDSFYGDIDF